MQYAFFGTAKSESLDRFARLIGDALEGVGFTSSNGDAQDANLVISLVDLDDPKPFRRRGGHVRRRRVRARRAPDRSRSRSRPTTRCSSARSRTSSLCYVPGEGAWFTTMERGHYGDHAPTGRAGARRGGRRAAAPARQLAARDRQRVPHRPRAGALGRRRDHGGDPRGGRPARRARPAARARSRSRTCSTSASSATSSACTASAASRTATSRSARTSGASG